MPNIRDLKRQAELVRRCSEALAKDKRNQAPNIQNLQRQVELVRRCSEALAQDSRRKVNRRALYVGVGTTAATGTTLTAITATLGPPTANLGGYATAQIVAALFGTGGPWLSTAIAAAGGPVTVTVLASIGLGGAAWGGARLFGGMFRRKRRW